MVAEWSPGLRVGVPRSILHYEFGGSIVRFLDLLGVDVLLSPPTNQEIFRAGKRMVIDEICFPIKIFVGHVGHLVDQGVDRILVPVIAGHENDRMFPCHPRSRLADIVRALGVCSKDQLIVPAFRFDQHGLTCGGFIELARELGVSEDVAVGVLQEMESRPSEVRVSSASGGLRIGLVGRSYVIQDSWANNNLVERMENAGCCVLTEEDATPIDYAPGHTGLHFALAAHTIAIAEAWDSDPEIDGIVFLLPFNCGPDGDIARHLGRTVKTPMLTLVLDELQSSAGLVTRIEAFIDLLHSAHAVTGGRSS